MPDYSEVSTMKDDADSVSFRNACEADLRILIELLNDDKLGSARESKDDTSFAAYVAAFRKIDASPDNVILLAERGAEIIGMLQLTLIPGLTHKGGLRAQIEGVRVKRTYRGQGTGRLLFDHAIRAAASAGCHMVQLTTDRQRPDALRFYKSLGFVDSHSGMKLILSRNGTGEEGPQ